jgi:bla regulator protein blaR1
MWGKRDPISGREAIMLNRVASSLNFAKKATMAILGTAALAVPVIVGILHSPSIRAQAPTPAMLKFEVASIRPCESGDSPGPGGTKGGGPDGSGGSPSPGTLSLHCATVAGLIQQAYGRYLNGHSNPPWSIPPISGGPAWINSERYDINAKAEGDANRELMNGPMMQALLEDRFKLKIRREAREVPVYALTVSKGGPKLQPFKEGSCTPNYYTGPLKPPAAPGKPRPCNQAIFMRRNLGTANMQGMTLDEYSKSLGRVLDRPIIDKTGIAGRFDFRLEFAIDQTTPGFLVAGGGPDGGPRADPPDPAGPSIFTAVQEQLGLKLEPTRGPREFLVIDNVEKPSAN